MVDDFYNYISNRMRQMGVAKFSVAPIYIQETIVAGSTYRIQAQNRYLYLINESVDPGLKIVADNNIFNDPTHFGTYNFNYLQEFTGGIEVTLAPASTNLSLEFIEVIPEEWIPNPECKCSICFECLNRKK